jgi:hypothetical protein
MRGMKIVAMVLVAVVLISAPAMATSSAGVKLWLANWETVTTEFGGGRSSDLGDELMYMFQYSYVIPDSRMALSAQLGLGSGWKSEGETEESSRTDVLVNLSRRMGNYFHGGLGYHYMGQEDDSSGWEGTYHGPEVLAGVVIPLQDTGLALSMTGMYVPILFWDAEMENAGTNDGETYAYGFDVGITIKVESMRFAVGYREQDIEGDLGNPDALHYIVDDNFGGIYTSASIMW